jgi:predicted PurR-regulated permease PerM
MNDRKIDVTISNRTILRTILWVVLAILLYHFIGRITHPLTLIFTSFFLAIALNPVVSWMSRHLKIKSRVRATAAAYLVVIAILALFFSLVIPPLVRQTRDFAKDVPQIVDNFQRQDTSIARAAKRYKIDQKLSQSAKDFASHYTNFGSTILDTSKRVIGVFISILVVVVMTFMMLVEGPRWIEVFFGALSDKNREHHKRVARRMYKAVTGFVNGQVILAAIAGVFSLTALIVASRLLDVSINAAALAGIVAVFGLIPLFGNPISSSVVVLVCLLNSSSLALVMLIYFAIYYQVESLTLQPYVQSRTNELTPLLVFSSAILGIGFGGIIGAIVAIPVASIVKITAEEYYEHNVKHPVPDIKD